MISKPKYYNQAQDNYKERCEEIEKEFDAQMALFDILIQNREVERANNVYDSTHIARRKALETVRFLLNREIQNCSA